ncbi:Rieske (2Fe-2S) protein [Bacteroidetes/Chlorobi group bacterium Naka2016]|jgi:nitrite reductase/ring-hydroxylating ferredoxin subunit|nr:MAG: Rieske (2Fe-2S) protein [Bacteroidetes/Chlorobi group bacterium Naka2016]
MRFCVEHTLTIDGTEFIPTVNVNTLKENTPFLLEIEVNHTFKRITLVKTNRIIYAISNTCPHQHRESLHNGYIENNCIVCPEHGWTFDLETGENVDSSIGKQKLEKYELVIQNQIICIKLNSLFKEKWGFDFE